MNQIKPVNLVLLLGLGVAAGGVLGEAGIAIGVVIAAIAGTMPLILTEKGKET